MMLGVGLVAFLTHFLSKRVSKSLVEDERQLEIGGKIIHYICRWVAIIFLIYLGLCFLESWPPHWLERIQQRKIVAERVQNTGGWDALKKDCNELVQANFTNRFWWFRNNTNVFLPKTLAALKPRLVEILPENGGMYSVKIQIFGGHATGLRGQDFYTLKVICPSPSQTAPDPKVQHSGHRIVDGVYEEAEHS